MNKLKIYIDRLKNEQTCAIKETLPPDFLDIHEEELTFKDPVHLEGEVYLADDHLVLHLSIQTVARIPCSICNEEVSIPIQIKNLYSTHPLEEIKGALFDLEEEVRENILLQTPLFVECGGGKCPEREQVRTFLKQGEDTRSQNFPFSDLG